MRSILPIAGVLLALFAAGCVAVLAWELTKEAEREGETSNDDDAPDDGESDEDATR